MKEFSSKFENDFSMLSFIYSNIVLKNMLYVDIGASMKVTLVHKLFSILKEHASRFQVKLGDNAKYLVGGFGTINFHLWLSNSLEFDYVISWRSH